MTLANYRTATPMTIAKSETRKGLKAGHFHPTNVA
jgi:hypothetical protein